MTTIGEEAKEYEPQQTKNIADLDVVPTNIEIYNKDYKDAEGNPFTLKVITIAHEDYRVPVTVLKSLKAILVEKPGLKSFKVTKAGEGLKTTYTVIPLE